MCAKAGWRPSKSTLTRSRPRIAMRVKSDTGADAVYYLFSDYLGSTSEVRKGDGTLHSRPV